MYCLKVILIRNTLSITKVPSQQGVRFLGQKQKQNKKHKWAGEKEKKRKKRTIQTKEYLTFSDLYSVQMSLSNFLLLKMINIFKFYDPKTKS